MAKLTETADIRDEMTERQSPDDGGAREAGCEAGAGEVATGEPGTGAMANGDVTIGETAIDETVSGDVVAREVATDEAGTSTVASEMTGGVVGSGGRAIRRFALGALPAAGVTTGLFLAMAGLIAVDFKPAEAETTRLIGTITPTPIEETEIKRGSKPKLIETANKPPPPPRLTASKSEVDLPVLDFPPVLPKIDHGPVGELIGSPVVYSEQQVLPIRPPLVTYPRPAIDRGIEGECSVSMDVSAKGRPYNVVAVCTDSVFEREAVRAVSRVEFRPRLMDGVAVERRNVIYPLSFSLQ